MSQFLAGRFGVSTLAAIGLTLAGLSAAAAQSRATAPAALPVATEIRLAGDDKQSRLVMDVTQALGIRAFTLADPYRVVIDIPQTVFQLPPASGSTGRGLIKAYRYGLVMAGGSRIVIDVAKPVRIDKAAMLGIEGRTAGAAGARPVRDRSRSLHAPSGARPHRNARQRSQQGCRCAPAKPVRRSAPADRDRSRPWRPRYRHQGRRRRDHGKERGARFLDRLARPAREERAISRRR